MYFGVTSTDSRRFQTDPSIFHLPFSDVHILRVLSAIIHLLYKHNKKKYKHQLPAIVFIFSSSEWDIQTAETPPSRSEEEVCLLLTDALYGCLHQSESCIWNEFDFIFRNYSEDCKSICPEGVTVLLTVVLFIRLYYFFLPVIQHSQSRTTKKMF